MNTIEILETVKKSILSNLSAAEVMGIEEDDLEQEIYMITLELLQKGDVESLTELITVALGTIRAKLASRREKQAEVCFNDIGFPSCRACASHMADRMKEQVRARDIIDDLLENVLDPTEEVVIRLYYGIPTAEMCDQLHINPRHCSVLDILYLMQWHDNLDNRRRINEILAAAMKQLRVNAAAFMLLH